ncbi:MAG: SDR family oxidoreductase, partial [Nocardia sp.]|nr:SDR family oxidoreductase [Nocardia sp.]
LYTMRKAALIGFTNGLARDLGPRGITVNVVQPGSTDTEMNPADSAPADAQRAATALGRYAAAAEIASAVAYLAGDGGNFVTGSTLTVDGGANACVRTGPELFRARAAARPDPAAQLSDPRATRRTRCRSRRGTGPPHDPTPACSSIRPSAR